MRDDDLKDRPEQDETPASDQEVTDLDVKDEQSDQVIGGKQSVTGDDPMHF